MTATKNKGRAYAKRTSGNTYDVTYDRSVSFDRDMSGLYLNELVRSGFEVICDNGGYDHQRMQKGRLVDGEVVWLPK